MALNKQFSGNVYDRDNTVISVNFRYRGYHKQNNKWSNWYDNNGIPQYNINVGDASWLSQDGSVKTGDNILIVIETLETDVLQRQFCIYETTITSLDTQVQDIQLKDIQLPNVSTLWSLESIKEKTNSFNFDNKTILIARVNDTITTKNTFNNNYTWIYKNKTMRHQDNYLGQDIFKDRIGIKEVTYDWVDDSVELYTNDISHIYSNISNSIKKYTTVKVKVKNLKDMTVVDELYVQIRYNIPIPELTWLPNKPSVEDVLKVSSNIIDTDNRIRSISYKFDNIEVANNTNIKYTYSPGLGDTYIPNHSAKFTVNWNDGFYDNSFDYSKIIEMTNLPPRFSLTKEIIGSEEDNHIKFNIDNPIDPDGREEMLNSKWKIEYKTPFDNLFKIVYEPDYNTVLNISSKEWIFAVAGEYRISVTLKDEYGLESTESIIITLTSSANCKSSGSIKLNSGNWQLIAIPVPNKTIHDYFIQKVDQAIKVYNINKSVSDVIEVCTAYPGHINKFLSYIPGFTLTNSEHNFSHIMSDGTSINEITAFWVKCKDYKSDTNGQDIVIKWSQNE